MAPNGATDVRYDSTANKQEEDRETRGKKKRSRKAREHGNEEQQKKKRHRKAERDAQEEQNRCERAESREETQVRARGARDKHHRHTQKKRGQRKLVLRGETKRKSQAASRRIHGEGQIVALEADLTGTQHGTTTQENKRKKSRWAENGAEDGKELLCEAKQKKNRRHVNTKYTARINFNTDARRQRERARV